eukprot:2248365-Amphidinium_carterae.1
MEHLFKLIAIDCPILVTVCLRKVPQENFRHSMTMTMILPMMKTGHNAYANPFVFTCRSNLVEQSDNLLQLN